ncbi:TonB-dependent receptor plug domain-containing protein [Sporocytophaga myxococcoides]|uniref:TonB-dependent receptor plug domain-containing protein n=1 Tax=Sporocytophaga myxococcoides TaxID=153721 RepID=UPI00048D00EB|nr:TonB-dependent receptor plug domain-containing protein [Sporocytophaga myxococcoides]
MNPKFKNCILSAALAMAIPAISYAQTDSTFQQSEDITAISLEDLMNVKIVSASRSEEKAFEAPLSSFVVTRKEIFNSGATSIPEALRLCPGLFVKQMSNGAYDVTIRGMDNLPTHQYNNTNRFILVMIDNRPVFDYLQGGTYWQNLPIDIIDIERIEVVLGPSAPLYGPNAVTGVINIITKSLDKNGISATAHAQAGAPGTYIGQAYIGFKPSEKIDVSGSFNYQNRHRGTVDFYDFEKRQFITNLDSSSTESYKNPDSRKQYLPNPDLALEKTAGNLNVNLRPAEDIKIHLASGYNQNRAWYGISAGSPMTYLSNKSYYGMIKSELKGFLVQASILNGVQGLVGDVSQYQYKYRNIDAYIDYTIKVTDKFNIRPAINYQNSSVDDTPYTVDKNKSGIFNNKATMFNFAASLKADYTLGKFRFIGALRGDKFKFPEKLYLSYQGIVNFRVNEKNNLRLVAARSNSGSFIYDTYAKLNVGNIPPNPFNPFPTQIWVLGSKDRRLVTNDMLEIGYRLQLMENLQLDIAGFHQVAQNFSSTVQEAPAVSNNVVFVNMSITNLDLKAVQNGATIAMNLALSKNKINIKPFVTIQKTRLKNYSPYYSSPEGSQNPNYTTETQSDVDGKATPNVYGGFYANYTPNSKWNVNVNGYLMSKYSIYTLSSTQDGVPYNEFPISNINGKLILNAKISYQLTKNLNIFANTRNAFDEDSREFFGSDLIHGLYLAGIHFDY